MAGRFVLLFVLVEGTEGACIDSFMMNIRALWRW